MDDKTRIVGAGNTVVPAYLALKAKGFLVSREKHDSGGETWTAENDEVELVTDDPVHLLGLSVIYELRGKDWMANDKEIDNFLNEFD